MPTLRPFWRYYGGKWRAAPKYPEPIYPIIIEPFAGSAGYSLRYFDRDIILADQYPVISGIWNYLINASEQDILSIPSVESVEDLPAHLPQAAKDLVGFCLMDASVRPGRKLTAGRKKLASMGRHYEGWCENKKLLIARQLKHVRHWNVLEGGYEDIPSIEATWFIDPPYNNDKGRHYVHSTIDYSHLASWCLSLAGQVIVCENEGADWLPFQSFGTFKGSINGSGYSNGSQEVVYYGYNPK
jgi:site-specific DNA-adenine methylase